MLISPLRRALQTAYLVFKDHPNFHIIKFIVHPMLRENMHTVCDIPENFLDVKNDYEGKIPQLDFSLMERQENDWYIHQLQEPVRSKLLERVARTSHTEKEVLLEEILSTYPDRVESAFNTHQRVESFKSYLSDYI